MTPEFSLASITFSGGETIPLEPDSVTVIVGANNCGKTTCLREIPQWLADDQYTDRDRIEPKRQLVVSSVEPKKTGKPEDIEEWLRENVYLGPGDGWYRDKHYRWLGSDCAPSHLQRS